MRTNMASIWKRIFYLIVLCYAFPTDLLAAPSIPELIIVQPMYGEPSGIYVRWTIVPGVKGYEICKMIGNDGCNKDDPGWKFIGKSQVVYIDSFKTIPDVIYTYSVRAVDMKDIKSEPSKPRSTMALKIWPVTKSPGIEGCAAEESLDVMFGYNQLYRADLSHYVLHQALDLSGEKNIEGECVRSPVGGVVIAPNQQGSLRPQKDETTGKYLDNNRSVTIGFYLNGVTTEISFGHLEHVNKSLQDLKDRSIVPGVWLGNITSTYFDYDYDNNKPENNHTHINFRDKKNPLEVFGDISEYYDPYENAPELVDSNKDGQKIRFRKGPNKKEYLLPSNNGKVFGPVDIVVEARDAQSSYEPWQAPLKIGYYIQNGEKKNVVRSPKKPFILIDSRNKFFGDLDGVNWTTIERIETLFDVDEDLRAMADNLTRSWSLWFTYIVTNTTGTEGRPEDLDADQCWATDVRKDDNQSPNGYRAGYHAALRSQDAKFPDGTYHIGIRLEDYVHSYPDVKDHLEPVVVDNFSPYIEQVTLTSAVDSAPMYDAAWLPGAETPQGLQLLLAVNTANPIPVAGTPVHLVLTASEPMRDVSFRFDGQPMPVVLQATDDAQMIWEGEVTIPAPASYSTHGKLLMVITGHDTADNPLLDFADSSPKILPTRTDSGAWACPVAEVAAATTEDRNDAEPAAESDTPPPPQTCAVPSDAGDTAHQLTTLSVYGWTMTLPEAGACEESGGGVVCAFGTPKPNGSTAHYGRLALLPKEADPQSVTLMAFASSETTHHGLHFLPDGLRLEVQPNAEWFGDCAEESTEARCPDSLDCQGEHADNPQCRLPDPQEKSETTSLPYQIAVAEDAANEACRVTVTYTLPNSENKEVVLEIQPARLCQTLTNWNGKTDLQEAQAICGWESVKTTRLYASNERDDDDTTVVNRASMIGYPACFYSQYECQSHPFSSFNYECTESPFWKQCPPPLEQWRTVPTATGDGTRQVLISTTTYACDTWHEEQLFAQNPWAWNTERHPVWAEKSGSLFPYLIGWYEGSVSITSTNWSGEWVSQCQYQRAMQRIEPVNEMGLQISIPLNDPARGK